MALRKILLLAGKIYLYSIGIITPFQAEYLVHGLSMR